MSRPDSPLISAEQLHARLADDPRTVVLECSWRLGGPSVRPEYEAEHLPGAAWVDLEEALSGPPGEHGRHPLPDPDVFAAAMRAAGVDNDEHVVVYDRTSSLGAARCWWLLSHAGHEYVQVLDGGLQRWKELGLPVSDEPVVPEPGDFVATPPHRPVLDAEEAAEHGLSGILLDARPAERFRGENESVDPVAGHIPGARSAPALENLREDGRFLTPDDLAMRFTGHGIGAGDRVGLYCGSGVQAMHAALALEAAQIGAVPAVYVGSWSHWITDPERPVETGPRDPGGPGDGWGPVSPR